MDHVGKWGQNAEIDARIMKDGARINQTMGSILRNGLI